MLESAAEGTGSCGIVVQGPRGEVADRRSALENATKEGDSPVTPFALFHHPRGLQESRSLIVLC